MGAFLRFSLTQEYTNAIKQISNIPLDVHLMVENVKEHIDEYIGEFTFVINKHKRKVYERLNPILTWLNTPVL